MTMPGFGALLEGNPKDSAHNFFKDTLDGGAYLNDRNLVSARRAGRVVFYSLADDHVRTLIATGLEHAREDCPNRPRE